MKITKMKNIYFVYLILVSLFVLGCSKPANVQMEKVKEQQQINFDAQLSSRCGNMQNENEKNECYNKLEIKGITICGLITNSYTKELCLANVATKIAKLKKDILKCNTISRKLEKENCYMAVGIEQLNVSLCDHASFRKIDCYTKIAAKRGDTSICQKIQDNKYKSICFSQVAKAKRDLSLCNNLREGKDACYLEVGIETRDVSICQSIQYDIWRFSCYVSIAQIRQDPSICSNIEDIYGKYECYTQVAEERKDESVCKVIDDKHFKEECIFQTNKEKGDVRICDELKVEVGNVDEEYKKDFCYIDIATLTKNPKICEKVIVESNRGSCYGSLANTAISDGNVELCRQINDGKLRDYCYRDVVLEVE